MDITVKHEFPFPLDTVVAARHVKIYNTSEHPDIRVVEYLSLEEKEDEILTQRLMHLQIPPNLQKMITPEMAECVEHTTWHKNQHTAKFDILPKMMGKMLSWSGKIRFFPHPQKKDTTVRESYTIAKCGVPMMGGGIEKSIVKGYEKAMNKEFESLLHVIELLEKGEVKRPY